MKKPNSILNNLCFWKITGKLTKNYETSFLNDNRRKRHSRKKENVRKEEPKTKAKKQSSLYVQEAIRNSLCLEFTEESERE